MRKSLPLIVSFIFCFCVALSGCGKVVPPQPLPLSKAHEKFLKLAQEEYGFSVVLKPLPRTLWVYIPIEGLFDIAAGDGPFKQPNVIKHHSVNYLDGQYKNSKFVIQYDISETKKYTVDPGYTFAPVDEFKTIQRNILSALGEAYGDVEALPFTDDKVLVKRVDGDLDFKYHDKNVKHKKMVHSYVKTEKAPDFVILVFADIKKGMESRMLLAFTDFHRARFDASFMEEYHKRFIVEQPTGNKIIIGDKEGAYLKIHDYTWGEFLLRQILYRIDYQFRKSDFPPSGLIEDIIASTAALVFNYYEFDDYTEVNLHDLDAQVTHLFTKDDIKKIKAD